MLRRTLLSILPAFAATAAFAKPKFDALKWAIKGAWRNKDNAARDTYRHPYESLKFWGLKPKMTVIEIDPGGRGWWVEILAPFAHKTGGAYFATLPVLAGNANAQASHDNFAKEVADKSIYGAAQGIEFGMTKLDGLGDNRADMILVARAFHNWARNGTMTESYLAAFFKALKSGGILAVEQHRAKEGSDPKAGTGYVPESYVIFAAQAAGFKFVGRSEINANPKDTKDHPFGVWTLPPVRRSEQNGRKLTQAERAHFDAIGESDRMTLRFVKP